MPARGSDCEPLKASVIPTTGFRGAGSGAVFPAIAHAPLFTEVGISSIEGWSKRRILHLWYGEYKSAAMRSHYRPYKETIVALFETLMQRVRLPADEN